jgi:hypothetical protein
MDRSVRHRRQEARPGSQLLGCCEAAERTDTLIERGRFRPEPVVGGMNLQPVLMDPDRRKQMVVEVGGSSVDVSTYSDLRRTAHFGGAPLGFGGLR